KLAGQLLAGLTFFHDNANEVSVSQSLYNMSTGRAVLDKSALKAATTLRAGVMTAQNVTDLTTLKLNVASINKQIAALQKLISDNGGLDSDNVEGNLEMAQAAISNIAVEILNGTVNVLGAAKLVKAGYVPYLFRWTRKRNRYNHKKRTDEDRERKHCAKSKGWHLYGSAEAVKLSGNKLMFTTNPWNKKHVEAEDFSDSPDSLVIIHEHPSGSKTITWGRSTVSLHDEQSDEPNKFRIVRLRFAVGFGKPVKHGIARITPCNLVSNLAEFSIVLGPKPGKHDQLSISFSK
ncbi:MAG: hypothetical protein J1E63_04090, partial [Muribaculaceae bacterium]|nr:hypothetical protein [Muribaculaceae bacterium]